MICRLSVFRELPPSSIMPLSSCLPPVDRFPSSDWLATDCRRSRRYADSRLSLQGCRSLKTTECPLWVAGRNPSMDCCITAQPFDQQSIACDSRIAEETHSCVFPVPVPTTELQHTVAISNGDIPLS